jgi:anti-sigma factor ChrR (cupin superfamily)
MIFKDIFKPGYDYQTLPWQPFRPGVEIYELYQGETGSAAALLKYEAGAGVPQHTHSGFEHIFILEGSQSDQIGTYEAGTLVINQPDSTHNVASKAGCIVLIIWERPVVMEKE